MKTKSEELNFAIGSLGATAMLAAQAGRNLAEAIEAFAAELAEDPEFKGVARQLLLATDFRRKRVREFSTDSTEIVADAEQSARGYAVQA